MEERIRIHSLMNQAAIEASVDLLSAASEPSDRLSNN